MHSNKELLQKAKLYLILDASVNNNDAILKVAEEAIVAGVDIIQIRAKGLPAKYVLDLSVKIKPILRDAILIINDRVDLTLLTDAHGVHVGQDDIPLQKAREFVGRHMVGVSCQTLKQAQLAQEQGADYIGFGSIFKTKTKPERSPMNLDVLKEVIKNINIPVFPIGGIDLKNIAVLHDLGVRRFAVCRSISEASNIKETVKAFRKYCE
ncbi:MAG: thiamine-phosphate pyrophosphorylase [Candidatus Omnitrophota bacterium]|jgi:thiamine-phosphate pyrophosphorylase